jgi:hypothetical protein
MNEDEIREIRKIVREEMGLLIAKNNLSDKDIIVKDSEWSQKDTAKYGTIQFIVKKKLKNMVIMVMKKGFELPKIVVFVGGLYLNVQVGFMFFLGKRLPDPVDLTQRFREDAITLVQNIKEPEQAPNIPEQFVVYNPKWKNLSEPQYTALAHEILAGNHSPEEVIIPDTILYPASTSASIIDLSNTSDTPDDFIV